MESVESMSVVWAVPFRVERQLGINSVQVLRKLNSVNVVHFPLRPYRDLLLSEIAGLILGDSVKQCLLRNPLAFQLPYRIFEVLYVLIYSCSEI